MTILQIEHPISDFDEWKAGFDSDPISRKEAGMRRYRILRPIDDRKYVIVDCEFDTSSEAEAFLLSLRGGWKPILGKILESPRARISIVMEGRSC